MCFNFTFVHRAMVAWCREARRFDCGKRRGAGRGQVSDAPVTKARAEELMRWTIRQSVLPQVVRLCAGIRQPEQLAALLDFTFNLGPGNLKVSTLRRRVNEGAWDREK